MLRILVGSVEGLSRSTSPSPSVCYLGCQIDLSRTEVYDLFYKDSLLPISDCFIRTVMELMKNFTHESLKDFKESVIAVRNDWYFDLANGPTQLNSKTLWRDFEEYCQLKGKNQFTFDRQLSSSKYYLPNLFSSKFVFIENVKSFRGIRLHV